MASRGDPRIGINPPPESYVDRRLRELEQRIKTLEAMVMPTQFGYSNVDVSRYYNNALAPHGLYNCTNTEPSDEQV